VPRPQPEGLDRVGLGRPQARQVPGAVKETDQRAGVGMLIYRRERRRAGPGHAADLPWIDGLLRSAACHVSRARGYPSRLGFTGPGG